MSSNKRSMQQNVDNMETLTDTVVNFQPAYDPSETRLSIQSQKEIRVKAIEAISALSDAKRIRNDFISLRTDAFAQLDPVVTRVINALRIINILKQTLDEGESIVRELRNKRASEIEPLSKNADGTEKEESPKTNKKRSGSFETRIENFGNLVKLVTSIEAYKPKEADLTVESLKTRLDTLIQVNSDAKAAVAKAKAVKELRNIVLGADKTGLYDIGMDSKLYVKSAYGATSMQYKSVSGIVFTKMSKGKITGKMVVKNA